MRVDRATRRTTVKVAVYAVFCLGFLFWLITLVANARWFRSASSYKAQLDDVTGLVANDTVKIAGVEVGKVRGIRTEHGHALVSFTVDRDVHLTTTTRAGVRWRNVLGAKYLYLYPGSAGAALKRGATIPLSQTVPTADVGDFLNALGPFLRAIDPREVNAFVQAMVGGLQGNEVKVRDLLANAAVVADTVGSLDGQVGRTIDNLDQVVGALAQRDSAVDALVKNLADVSSTLAQRNDTIQQLVEDFSHLQGQLSTLLRDNRANIDTTIANLQTVTDVLRAHEADVEEGIRTLGSGLAPYHLISSYGQWFQIRAVYVCLAQESTCSAESTTTGLLRNGAVAPGSGQVVRPASGTVPSGGSDRSVADIVGFALDGRSAP